ncbi:PAS domain S-box protein [Thermonema rossianum]|uniref:PAS domain S-box protein n=1 Tax=Thermonema rossianum TaxID=55505 RepID=UPI00068C4786|nr:PAS domain S-box protein [Thermonema rossianum]
MMKTRKNISLGLKITVVVLLVALLAVASVSYFAFQESKTAFRKSAIESLHAVSALKVEKINTFVHEIERGLSIGTRLNAAKRRILFDESGDQEIAGTNPFATDENDPFALDYDESDILPDDPIFAEDNQPLFGTQEQEDSLPAVDPLTFFLTPEAELDSAIAILRKVYDLHNIYLLDEKQNIKYIADKKTTVQEENKPFKPPVVEPGFLEASRDSLHFSKVFLQDNAPYLLAAAPVKDNEDRIGYLVFEIDFERIDRLINDRTGLGNTGEVLLVQLQGSNTVYVLNKRPLLEKDDPVKSMNLTQMGTLDALDVPLAVRKALSGEQAELEETDDRGKEVLAVTDYVPQLQWGVIAKIDTSEVYAPAFGLLKRFLLSAGITLLVALLIGLIFSQFFVQPLGILRDAVASLAKGRLPASIEVDSKDEVGEMASYLNRLVANLRSMANFASRIGKKDFDVEFKPAGEDDVLATALLAMRDSIVASAKEEDEKRWIVEGVKEVGDILRARNDLKEMGEELLAYVVQRIGAVQGAFYVMNESENEEGVSYLEMYASYAYNKKKYLEARFKVTRKYAEGLVGQAAIERDMIRRTEIPEDYLTVTSGLLGEQRPRSLLIMPLITNETEVMGCLELASLHPFEEDGREVKFVQEISGIIARTIFNIKTAEKEAKLLAETTQLNVELQARQKELEKIAKDLQEKSRELQKTVEQLELEKQAVQNEQRKTQILLENASEVIIIYDETIHIRYISPSVERILGYGVDEMVGINDEVHVEEEWKEAYRRMFEELKQYPDERVTIQMEYRKKSGEAIWVEVTGTNLLQDPVIKGIVVNMRDITERKRAEREERMRSQMQALSENSPDLIMRLNLEGVIYYINPTIENYTAKAKEEYLQKVLSNELLPEEVVRQMYRVLEGVSARREKVTLEINFPSVLGDRVMQLNAIPEFGEDNELESILVVLHDITVMKEYQLEIETANKKVTDSINYAKRIQDAIMPDTQLLRSYFADSFVIFKPRDVVSGDFPWIVRKGDYIYVAAADCTGHGVPGALVSLIGYFLMNNIIDTHSDILPNDFLDLLDKEMTHTLRQDREDSVTRDGMDVSLARIDLKNNKILYAGAHRPLYYLYPSDEDVQEIKGDKMPIGGGQFRDRDKFSVHELDLTQGLSIYLFSDGMPDQFGGPQNRKFSSKRIRNILLEHRQENMDQIAMALDTAFVEWMGDNKQTDDVLFIGIRF